MHVKADRYRKLTYPKPNPRAETHLPVFVEEKGSPRVGEYYRVIQGHKTIEGYLDHVARLRTGCVVGFLYSPEGRAVGSAPVTKHAAWFRLH